MKREVREASAEAARQEVRLGCLRGRTWGRGYRAVHDSREFDRAGWIAGDIPGGLEVLSEIAAVRQAKRGRHFAPGAARPLS